MIMIMSAHPQHHPSALTHVHQMALAEEDQAWPAASTGEHHATSAEAGGAQEEYGEGMVAGWDEAELIGMLEAADDGALISMRMPDPDARTMTSRREGCM